MGVRGYILPPYHITLTHWQQLTLRDEGSALVHGEYLSLLDGL
ncbi:hypothetical protein [Komagataeibacter diospyri]|nr:hypothetical protein [Komagataeibacter diospyri]